MPSVDLEAQIGAGRRNVNMVTCGGQATIPMAAAVSRVQALAYGEIIATMSSKSVGPGTRKNIDEHIGDTVHALTVGGPDQAAITVSYRACWPGTSSCPARWGPCAPCAPANASKRGLTAWARCARPSPPESAA